MLPPPRIGFREPEGVEARGVASLRHANGFVERLHAELQHTDFERHAHLFAFSPFMICRCGEPISRSDRSRNVPNLLPTAKARDSAAWALPICRRCRQSRRS